MDQEFRRIVPAADTAVLFIHGIVGTPRHFDDLIPLLPDTVSVHNLLLAGHGGSARDFARASMKTWEQQVEAAIAALAETHPHIVLAADGSSVQTQLCLQGTQQSLEGLAPA